MNLIMDFNMNMTNRKLGVVLCCLMAVASCQKESQDVSFDNEISTVLSDDEICFSSMDVDTRADVTSLSSFNVMCITGTMGSSETSQFNKQFSKSGSYYYGSKYWPSSDAKYGFYASNNTITAASNGAYVSASNSNDVVVAYRAYNASDYKQTIGLIFNHIFAKLGYCKVSAPSGYSVSGLSVKMTPYVSGYYKIYSGTWSSKSAGSQSTLTTSLNSTASAGTYVVPGTYTLTLAYTLSKDSYTEAFSKSVSVTLVAGKTNNIVLNLPDGNSSGAPDGGVVIDPWEGGGNVDEGM